MNAQSILIIVILVIIMIPAVKGTLQHMKGEGACCGGPKEKAVRKKIKGKPISSLTLSVEGMHCNNCKNRIENHLNALDGVVAKVSLSKKCVRVDLYKEVNQELLIKTIEKLDFKVL